MTANGHPCLLVRIHTCAYNDDVFDEGFNGLLWHMGEQSDHDLTTALHHPKDGWSFLPYDTTATCTLESASTTFPSLALSDLRLPLMTNNHIGFITSTLLHSVIVGFFSRMAN